LRSAASRERERIGASTSSQACLPVTAPKLSLNRPGNNGQRWKGTKGREAKRKWKSRATRPRAERLGDGPLFAAVQFRSRTPITARFREGAAINSEIIKTPLLTTKVSRKKGGGIIGERSRWQRENPISFNLLGSRSHGVPHFRKKISNSAPFRAAFPLSLSLLLFPSRIHRRRSSRLPAVSDLLSALCTSTPDNDFLARPLRSARGYASFF